MSRLWSRDYELQCDVVVRENPTIAEVAFCLKNGDVSFNDALCWCEAENISAFEFIKVMERIDRS